MCWPISENETGLQVFTNKVNDLTSLPNKCIIDVVHDGGLERYAENSNVQTQSELYDELMYVCNKTVVDPVFYDKKRMDIYPPLYNFFCYCSGLQRKGRLTNECESIASAVWNGKLVQRRLKERCDALFSIETSEALYNKAVHEMIDIWGFSDTDINALRYFACQCKNYNHNPSQNKELYLYGETKQTGKTTFARALATALNADKFDNFGKYESSFAKEMGFNEHDLPLACIYNCTILDEAMPKDSRKSYGPLKSMFTSNSYNYNPKFRQVINVPARRNYICTSNDDIVKFVQDRFERRFYAIKFDKKPKQISFPEIYDIILRFCIHATPLMDWQEWYNSFDFVAGVAEEDKNIVSTEIINLEGFFEQRTTFTIKQLANALFKNEPTREQYESVKTAINELAPNCTYPSNPYSYDARKVQSILKPDIYVTSDSEDANDLPF